MKLAAVERWKLPKLSGEDSRHEYTS